MPSMSDYQKLIDDAMKLVDSSHQLLQTTINPKHVKIARKLVVRFETLQKILNDFSKRAAKVGVDDFTAPVSAKMSRVGTFLEGHPSQIAKDWATAGGELAGVEQWATQNEPGLVFLEGVPDEVDFITKKLEQLTQLSQATDDDTRLIAAKLRWDALDKRLKADGATIIANMDSIKSDIAAVKTELDGSITHSRKALAGAVKDGLLKDLGISGPKPTGKEAAEKRARLETWAADFAGNIASNPSQKRMKRLMDRAVKRINWLEEQASSGAMMVNVQQASWRQGEEWEPLLQSIGSSGVCLALTLEWLGKGGNPDTLEDGALSQKVQVSQQAGRIQRAFESSRHPNILDAERKRLAALKPTMLQKVRDAVDAAESPLGSPVPTLQELEGALTTLEEREEQHRQDVEALEDQIEDLKDEQFELEGERDTLDDELQELEEASPKDDEAIRAKTTDRDDKQQELDTKTQELTDAETDLERLRAVQLQPQVEAAQMRVAMWKAIDDVESLLEPISTQIDEHDAEATAQINESVKAHQTGTVESLKEAKNFDAAAQGKLIAIETAHNNLIALAATLKGEPVPEEAEPGPRDELPAPFLKAMGITEARRPDSESRVVFTEDTAVEEISRLLRTTVTGVDEGTAAGWHISLKGSSGHALGLRLKEDGGIEFLDANAGGYSFADLNAFEAWVPGWWDTFGLKDMSSIMIVPVS
ncbi:MAG: hypothetical protein AAFV53_11565 [Myxococcota bacterium]